MLRQWLRMSSIACAAIVLLLVFSGINYLPEGRNLVESWEKYGASQETHNELPEPEARHKPAIEDNASPPTVFLNAAFAASTQTFSAAEHRASIESVENTTLSLPSSTVVIVPTSTELSKIVVMGKTSSENVDWVSEDLPEWQNAVYYVDLEPDQTSPSGLRTKVNKGKEGNPYLSYIVDHYPNFPDVVAFVHAHKDGHPLAWHTDHRDYSAVVMLSDLRLEHVAEHGYANLRCEQFPGCPNEVQPWRDPPVKDRLPERLYPYVYAEMFEVPYDQLRSQVESVGVACCAQFAVSKEQILKRPKSDYERWLAYLEQTTFEDDVIGRVYEYMWHVMFGRDVVHCPDASTCRCEVFGHCATWN